MFRNDKLARAALYPKCITGGVFDEVALLLLTDIKKDGKVYALSLASRFMLRDADGVHSYGVRAASTSNKAYFARNQTEPSEEKKVRYLGFYDLLYADLMLLNKYLEHYTASVPWRLEHGENAHFQLELTNKGLIGDTRPEDKIRRNDRSAAMTILSMKLFGPSLYMETYENFENATSTVTLPVLPVLPRGESASQIS